MERIIKGHEIRDGNDVWGGGLYVGGGKDKAYEITVSPC